MASTTTLDLSKKSLKPRTTKPSIPVRQTKTSKIRSELGNQLEYLKNDLQKLRKTAAASTSRLDITNSKESIKSENDAFKKPFSMSRKSVVSRSSEVISRTNSGLKHSTYNINKSPTRNKSIPIKSTQSETKFKPTIQKNHVKTSQPSHTNTKPINTVKIGLNKTTQPSQQTQNKNVKTCLNKTTQPSQQTQNKNVKTCLNKTTQPSQQTQNKNVKTCLNKTTQPSQQTQNKIVKICLNKTTQQSAAINNIKEKNKTNNHVPKIATVAPLLKPTLVKTRENTIKNEKKTVKIRSPLRKSISAMHLKRVSIRDPTKAIYRSFSAVNVSETIDEHETLQIPNFTTPMAKRRSIFNSTPMTAAKNSKNVSPWNGCWSPAAQDLKRRLSIWMEKTGQPYHSFNNLRCFGMHYLPAQEENKENVRVEMKDKDSSYEDLKIQLNEKDEATDDISVGYEALHDLHKLILEGYPVDQCEAWLDVIRTRFEDLEDKQQYWECMAAIDEARGNTKTCYKNDENDSYLDNLLQKFNVLNLTPSSCHQRRQRRNTLNNSGIFKSTAINFSVTEISKNNEEKEYLVTPIKRSTRQSTANKLTPGVIICSTLDELESPVRNSMRFRTNKALKK